MGSVTYHHCLDLTITIIHSCLSLHHHYCLSSIYIIFISDHQRQDHNSLYDVFIIQWLSWLLNQMISQILIFGCLCRSSIFQYPDYQEIWHSNVLQSTSPLGCSKLKKIVEDQTSLQWNFVNSFVDALSQIYYGIMLTRKIQENYYQKYIEAQLDSHTIWHLSSK